MVRLRLALAPLSFSSLLPFLMQKSVLPLALLSFLHGSADQWPLLLFRVDMSNGKNTSSVISAICQNLSVMPPPTSTAVP